MSTRNFRKMLEAKWAEGKFVCVGLDSEYAKIPLGHIPNSEFMGRTGEVMLAFNKTIVDATHDTACAFKPNYAFYAAFGQTGGITALRNTISYIHAVAPDVPVILDVKVADIGNTNVGYVQRAFEDLDADAVTVHPYLGEESLRPFLDCADKGIIVLCRTSNPGAGEFQDLPILLDRERRFALERHLGREIPEGHVPLYLWVAFRVATSWNKNNNCAVVVGATYPDELAAVRQIVRDMPILIPGIGAQGGEVEKTVKAGRDERGRGMIINSSRGIIFASSGTDFAEAARRETLKLHESINQHRIERA